jgi:hypothetical protein
MSLPLSTELKNFQMSKSSKAFIFVKKVGFSFYFLASLPCLHGGDQDESCAILVFHRVLLTEAPCPAHSG